METIKFLVLDYQSEELGYGVICQNGEIINMHCNGKKVTIQHYPKRITVDTDFEYLFEYLCEGKPTYIEYDSNEVKVEDIMKCINILYTNNDFLPIIEYIEYDAEFDELMSGNTNAELIEKFIRENNLD